jgi:hypothetical protein
MNSLTIHPSDYLPVEVIFNLLSVCRSQQVTTMRELRLALQRRGLVFGNYRDIPPLPFWLRICQTASLLDEQDPPFPTMFAEDWLSYPLWEQLTVLLEAWYQAPQTPDLQRLRMRLPRWLLEGIAFGRKGQRELSGLQALKIFASGELTAVGEWIMGGQSASPTCQPPVRWNIETEDQTLYTLVVPYPPDWQLLWQLEAYFEPASPGIFVLDNETLRKAATRAAACGREVLPLISLLEQGTGTVLSNDLKKMVDVQPRARLLPGPVLEFGDAQELVRLRQSRSWRRELQNVLSPRHVQIDLWHAPVVLRRLERIGLVSAWDIDRAMSTAGRLFEQAESQRQVSLSKAERAFCLSLLLMGEGLLAPFAAPPGFFHKLISGLDDRLRASAARKANQAIEQFQASHPQWTYEEQPPKIPASELVSLIEEAIRLEQTLDIIYQATGRSSPEFRHVTPLLLEQRASRYYLLAYCHNRRANRTFRLDRLKLVD